MIRQGVWRLDPVTHAWITNGDGWQFELFGLWIAKFSKGWIEQYGSTWAIAYKRGETRFYYPREKSYGH